MKKQSEEQDKNAEKVNNRAFRFLKQYLTLNRAELFFADKAVLIEGDTERILISAMMKKLDDFHLTNNTANYQPLLAQNISIVEVGAYSQIFSEFLGFIGIKTLIITDLDCGKYDSNDSGTNRLKKCKFKEGTHTTNSAIKYFLGKDELKTICELAQNPIVYEFDKRKNSWVLSTTGTLRIIFQKEENSYTARSFEDAFLSQNMSFIKTNLDNFTSLKNRKKITEDPEDFYDISNDCIEAKTGFALDVLLLDGENNERWGTPLYIKEGLEWLAQ